MDLLIKEGKEKKALLEAYKNRDIKRAKRSADYYNKGYEAAIERDKDRISRAKAEADSVHKSFETKRDKKSSKSSRSC